MLLPGSNRAGQVILWVAFDPVTLEADIPAKADFAEGFQEGGLVEGTLVQGLDEGSPVGSVRVRAAGANPPEEALCAFQRFSEVGLGFDFEEVAEVEHDADVVTA